MFFTRKIGKLIRGTATPFQIFSAGVIGGIVGSLPGFVQAPGLTIFCLLIVMLLNANLALAALVAVAAKIITTFSMPVLFAIGRFFMDGPLQGLFEWMINTPVLALFGFEYYATTGALVFGTLFGVFSGWVVTRLINDFRKKMVALEKDSEKFKDLNNKGYIKLLKFVFVGGGIGKKTYEELLEKKVGNPIRPLGVVFAILLCVLVTVIQMFASGPIITAQLISGLEQANGATVDIESAELSLKENRLKMTGIAMADPNALDTDLFRAATLEADVSATDLLTKRLRLDKVVVSDASTGEKRTVPGRLISKAKEKSEEEAPAADAKSIDDYIEDAKKWKERLKQIEEWMEKLSGPETDESGAPEEESLDEQIQRQIEELGHANVKAKHLIQGAPTFAVTELIAEKVRTPQLEGETLDVHAKNLSTQPWLMDGAPEIDIKSSGDTLTAFLKLGESTAGAKSQNEISVKYLNLPTDLIAKQIKFQGQQTLSGGSMDLNLAGPWQNMKGINVNMPLEVTLKNATINLPQMEGTTVEEIMIPIGITGPLSNPSISAESKAFTDMLVKAGVNKAKSELTKRATEEIEKKLGDKLPGDAGNMLKGLFGGDKK